MTSPGGSDDSISNGSEESNVMDLIRRQVEYYLSPENISRDGYLVSRMDSEQYVALSLLATFPALRRITTDIELIATSLRKSESVQLHPNEQFARARPVIVKSRRTTIMLRNIPAETPREEVVELFAPDFSESIIDVRSEVNNNWFVSFDDETVTQDAFFSVRSRKFRGSAISGCVKNSNTIHFTDGNTSGGSPQLSPSSSPGGRGVFRGQPVMGQQRGQPQPGAFMGRGMPYRMWYPMPPPTMMFPVQPPFMHPDVARNMARRNGRGGYMFAGPGRGMLVPPPPQQVAGRGHGNKKRGGRRADRGRGGSDGFRGGRANVPSIGGADFPPLPSVTEDHEGSQSGYTEQKFIGYSEKEVIEHVTEALNAETLEGPPDDMPSHEECSAVSEDSNSTLLLGSEQKTKIVDSEKRLGFVAAKSFAEVAVSPRKSSAEITQRNEKVVRSLLDQVVADVSLSESQPDSSDKKVEESEGECEPVEEGSEAVVVAVEEEELIEPVVSPKSPQLVPQRLSYADMLRRSASGDIKEESSS